MSRQSRSEKNRRYQFTKKHWVIILSLQPSSTVCQTIIMPWEITKRPNDIRKKALKIRRELLKDHRDTAKSLFDLAMVHKMKGEFKLATDCLEKCEAMLKKILDEGNDALKSTRKELKEVTRREPWKGTLECITKL